VPSRDRDERNGFGVVANLLDEVGDFLDDFFVTRLGVLGGVHLVDGNNELLDTKGVSEESVLTGLSVLGDTSFEFTGTGGNNKNGTIGLYQRKKQGNETDHHQYKVRMIRSCKPFVYLGSTGNHVLDEITMARSVNDGDVVLGGLEFPQGNVNGDTTFTLSLKER
jgi:hypothetical protein